MRGQWAGVTKSVPQECRRLGEKQGEPAPLGFAWERSWLLLPFWYCTNRSLSYKHLLNGSCVQPSPWETGRQWCTRAGLCWLFSRWSGFQESCRLVVKHSYH